MNDLIILLFHGSTKLKDYEKTLIQETKDNYPDAQVEYTYYSKHFKKYCETKLEDLLSSKKNIYINFIILSNGFNYNKVLETLKGFNVTKSILSYEINYLEEGFVYVAHGPQNSDYLKVKEKYPLLYLNEIDQIRPQDKVKLLFLSRSHHAREILDSKYDVVDEVLLENKLFRKRIHLNLKELINEDKNRN